LENASKGQFPRDVSAFGLDFIVHHGVFSPIMACVPVHEALAPFEGRELLDVGCGVGVLAVLAAKEQAGRGVGRGIHPVAGLRPSGSHSGIRSRSGSPDAGSTTLGAGTGHYDRSRTPRVAASRKGSIAGS